MRYPEFPVIGCLSATLVLIPLPRQIRAGNIACIALIFWLFQHCLISAINSIIWAGNVNNTAPVWCDITTKLGNGEPIAISAASLCICKRLEFISSLRHITSDAIQHRRKIFEVVMCFGIPGVWILLFYCFETDRFSIMEDFGCSIGLYRNNGITALLFGTPLLFSVISLVYGFIIIYRLAKNHFQIFPQLKSRDSLSSRQYFRLMAMGMFVGIWGVVWFSLEIRFRVSQGSNPIPSWKEIHKGDSKIIEVPTVLLGAVFVHDYYTLWWAIPGAALLLFLFFGTSYDVFYEYVKFWTWFRTTVLRQPLREKTVSTLLSQSAPSYRIDITVVRDNLESKLPTPPLLPLKD